MIIQSYRQTATPTLGSATGTFTNLKGSMCGITVYSLTATTTFSFTLTDPDGDPVFAETNIVGTLVDNTPIFLTKGTYTWAITSASVNELFVIKVKLLEANWT